jgi:hypothetical protein
VAVGLVEDLEVVDHPPGVRRDQTSVGAPQPRIGGRALVSHIGRGARRAVDHVPGGRGQDGQHPQVIQARQQHVLVNPAPVRLVGVHEHPGELDVQTDSGRAQRRGLPKHRLLGAERVVEVQHRMNPDRILQRQIACGPRRRSQQHRARQRGSNHEHVQAADPPPGGHAPDSHDPSSRPGSERGVGRMPLGESSARGGPRPPGRPRARSTDRGDRDLRLIELGA